MKPTAAPTGISALLRNVWGGRAAFAPRPEGPLVWLHLPPDAPRDSLPLLREALEDYHVLITQPEMETPSALHFPFQFAKRQAVDHFLAHWQPDLMLWAAPENGLMAARRSARAGVKVIFADIAEQGLQPGFRGRALSEFLQYCTRVVVSDQTDLGWFEKHGLTEAQLAHGNPLVEIAKPPPENEALHRRISGALGPRPVWCAIGVSRGEIAALLAAHRHAVKAFPNLLLLVVPRAAADVIAAKITDDGWRLGRLGADELPSKQAEVLLAEDLSELGTWMRLATVTYMGGTLYGPEAAEPFAAVAVGSAVLSGPMQAPYTARYARLIGADAIAACKSKAEFSACLVAVLAPDRSAELAMNAWKIGSEGAASIQAIVREIKRLMEEEAGHESP